MKRARRAVVLAAVTAVAWTVAATAYATLPSAPATKFTASPGCGCHSGFLEQWGRSMHAKALVDPVYLYKKGEANRATGGKLGAFCDSCHGPIATMAGQTDLAKATPQAKEGVSCDFCHQVTGTFEPPGNVSQKLVLDETKRAQFKDAVSPAHKTAYSAFHESAEFCGACHNVNHPVNGMHLESTYTEWKNGPYAKEGIQCQDCHMTPGPGVTKPYPGTAAAGGPQRDHIYLMTFAGGNVGLGDSTLAEERLKAAARLDVEAPDILASGSKGTVKVTITNVGAGHYIPTGLTEVREMWLEVTAKNAAGEDVVIGKHVFGSELKDAKGNSPVELWDAVAFAKDDRIPPKGSSTDNFEFEMPAGDQVELSAALYYRSCSEEMAKSAGADIPTTTMASFTKPIYSSEAARKSAEKATIATGGGNGLLLGIAVGGLGLSIVLAAVFVMTGRKKAEE